MNPTVTSQVEPSARAAVVATTFAHPAHVVWTLFSDPSELALWWGPPGMSMVVHEHDLRPGGAVEFAVSAGATELSGRWAVHDVDEPRRLRFTFASDGLDPTEITIDLHETSTGSTVSTAMTITCSFTSDTRMRQAPDIGFIEGLARAVVTAHAQLGRPAVRSRTRSNHTRGAVTSQPCSATAGEWAGSIKDVGFVIARQVLPMSEVEVLRAAFPPAEPGTTLHVDIDDETVRAHQWRSLHTHPGIYALLVELLVVFDIRSHGREPGLSAGAQGLHADRRPGRSDDIDAITLLWMLDDFTNDNGATRLVPRSHRGASAVPRHLAQPDTIHPDEIIVTGDAGDVLIFDAHLWHSGRRNTSGARRRAVQMVATRSPLEPIVPIDCDRT